MKRAPFIGAAAASFLTGCGGGRSALQALPGFAGLKPSQPTNLSTARLVPDAADSIPDTVLSHPIIGELRRFDGQVAPANWILCQGQIVEVSDNHPLFAILGSIVGGDGKKTFKLPTARAVIAVAGTFPSSALLVAAGRHMTLADSLGPNARPRPMPLATPPSAKLLADRQLLLNAVRVRPSTPTPISQDTSARMRQTEDSARSAALDKLSSANRALLLSVVDAAAAGRMTQFAAVRQMSQALTDQEASALVDVNDSLLRTFQPGWGGSERAQARLEAAYFAVSIAFTPAQKDELAAHSG